MNARNRHHARERPHRSGQAAPAGRVRRLLRVAVAILVPAAVMAIPTVATAAPTLQVTGIGTHALTRASSAPVLDNTTPGRRLVLAARFAARSLPARLDRMELRIVLKRPDGTLSAITLAPDGSLN